MRGWKHPCAIGRLRAFASYEGPQRLPRTRSSLRRANPRPSVLYAAVPWRELAILAGFGLAWGCGAVLFGLGMDMLGLTLGYPLIMGLNASMGTFVPLLWLYGHSMFAGRQTWSVH